MKKEKRRDAISINRDTFILRLDILRRYLPGFFRRYFFFLLLFFCGKYSIIPALFLKISHYFPFFILSLPAVFEA